MKEEQKRKKWLHLRLTMKEYDQIQASFSQTVHESLSDFARRLLLKKPIIGRYRDTGIQELLAQLTGLKRDLHGLATNYNQLAKKLNAVSESEVESHQPQSEKLQKGILDSLGLVDRFINQTVEKWLQS